MLPTDKPFRNPDVLLRDDFDDAAILFHPHLGEAIPVDGVARDLWRALDGTRPLAEIATDLAAQYDQAPEVVLDDALAFTQELYRRLFILTEPLPPVSGTTTRLRQFLIPAGTPAPARDPSPREQYRLTLADGARFVLRALDADAARVVTFFAESARLPQTSEVSKTSEVWVATRPFDAPGEIVCLIDPPNVLRRGLRRLNAERKLAFEYEALSPEHWLWLQLLQLAACIGAQMQARGGILLHSALAAHPSAMSFRAQREISDSQDARFLVAQNAPRNDKDTRGVLLTAHSGVGKTTASNRLPAPWVALCDDTTLIVRDNAGAYWAHPMPTWSHIFREEKISSWDTQTAVPLRAIFLLRQAEVDRVTPLGAAHAIGFLLERAQEPTQYWRENLSLAELGAFNLQVFDNLCALLRAVPCYLLDARLDGEFWVEMETALQRMKAGEERMKAEG